MYFPLFSSRNLGEEYHKHGLSATTKQIRSSTAFSAAEDDTKTVATASTGASSTASCSSDKNHAALDRLPSKQQRGRQPEQDDGCGVSSSMMVRTRRARRQEQDNQTFHPPTASQDHITRSSLSGDHIARYLNSVGARALLDEEIDVPQPRSRAGPRLHRRNDVPKSTAGRRRGPEEDDGVFTSLLPPTRAAAAGHMADDDNKHGHSLAPPARPSLEMIQKAVARRLRRMRRHAKKLLLEQQRQRQQQKEKEALGTRPVWVEAEPAFRAFLDSVRA